ncbi:MAG: UbiA prenyltransferase family protein [Planctomycetota bacterium]
MLFRRIKGYLKLLRPELTVMDITLPAVSAVLALKILPSDTLNLPVNKAVSVILTAFASYFATVGSYVFNDFVDVDIDKINLPERPLPSGKVKRIEALIYSLLLYGVSIFIFSFFSWYSVITVIVAALVITSYSAFFKRRTPLSFIPVGVAYGLVPVGVWFAFGTPETVTYVLAAMICVTDWGFTLSGVSRDVEGDKQKGAPTMPVTYGIPATSKFVFVCWVAGVGFTIAIWFVAKLGYVYLAGAILSGMWLLWKAAIFIKNPKPENGGRFFLQSANYRSILFLLLIVDIGIAKYNDTRTKTPQAIIENYETTVELQTKEFNNKIIINLNKPY